MLLLWNSLVSSLHVGYMSLSSRLQNRRTWIILSAVFWFFFYLQIELCGVSLSTQAGGSYTSPGKIVQDVAVAVCCWSVVPGFSSTVSLLSDCKLTHFTSLQQQQQQHMLRQIHAALASSVNHFFTAALRANIQDVGYCAEGPVGLGQVTWLEVHKITYVVEKFMTQAWLTLLYFNPIL